MSQPKRDWTDARAKVDAEGQCRVCRCKDRPLQAAHVSGRRYDEHLECGICEGTGVRRDGERCRRCAGSGWSKALYVNPDRIVPLCEHMTEDGCHSLYDAKKIDLLPYLTIDEQVQAVIDLGGIELARKCLAPTAYESKIAARQGA